jgi:hypothetical protein
MPFNSVGSSLPNVLQNTMYGNLEKQSKYKFAIQTPNVRFYLNNTKTTFSEAIGFATTSPSPKDKQLFSIVSQWPNSSDVIVTTVQNGMEFVITSPGIVNLNGLSYVILRCPEVESHISNSFSYSQNCPGIGMFKLGAMNQIISVRLDFVNFIRKPFHPIGKLPKITLKFETTEGASYDFKGVDHNLLLSVKFYVPKPKTTMQKFILNPNYNPDYLEYMVNEMRITGEQNATSIFDASLNNRTTDITNTYNNLINEQNDYDYSSEEDDDETDIIGKYIA